MKDYARRPLLERSKKGTSRAALARVQAHSAGARARGGRHVPEVLTERATWSVQAKAGSDTGRDDRSALTPGAVHRMAEEGVAGAGGALPHLAQIQRAFGSFDLGRVHAVVGGPAAATSRALGAVAYTTGEKIGFGRSPDLHTAAHEAAHVIQQRSGVALPGGIGRAGDRNERAADRIADRVVRGEPAEADLDRMTGGVGRRPGAPCAPNPGWTMGLRVQKKEGSLFDKGGEVKLTGEWQEFFAGPLWQRFAGSNRDWKTLRQALKGLGYFEDERQSLNDPRKVALEGKLGMVILNHAELWLDAVKKVTAYVVGELRKRNLATILPDMQLTPDDYGGFISNQPGAASLQSQVESFLGKAQSASIAEQFVLHNGYFALCEKEDKKTASHMYRRTARVKPFFDKRGRDKVKAEPVHGLRGIGEELLEPPPARPGGTSPLGPTELDTRRGVDVQQADESVAGNQLIRLIDMPLAATISGNTADYMYLAEKAGADKWDYGMAAMGRMLVAGHHSFHEIAIVLAGAGVATYIDGDYRAILPDKLKQKDDYQGLVAQYPDLLMEQEEQIDKMITEGRRDDEKGPVSLADLGIP